MHEIDTWPSPSVRSTSAPGGHVAHRSCATLWRLAPLTLAYASAQAVRLWLGCAGMLGLCTRPFSRSRRRLRTAQASLVTARGSCHAGWRTTAALERRKHPRLEIRRLTYVVGLSVRREEASDGGRFADRNYQGKLPRKATRLARFFSYLWTWAGPRLASRRPLPKSLPCYRLRGTVR